MSLLKKINEKLNVGKKCVLATVVEKKGDGPLATGGKLLLDETYNRYGTIAGGDLELMIIKKCKEILETKRNELILYNLSADVIEEANVDAQMICGGQARIFFEYFEPKENLYIYGGAGNVGKEICVKSVGLDFKLHVVDQFDPNFDFDYIFHKGHDSLEEDLFQMNDYHVIATGSHQVDYEILKTLMGKDLSYKYLGMLASENKIKELLDRLEEDLNKQPRKIYSPIGLNIGGPTPPEIAISVLSQIQSIKYNVNKIEDLGVIE
jgi:xanthine dehydrogenase accessory factor